jgi:UDP-N-acetylenolpyruvoylglucosamine reductase
MLSQLTTAAVGGPAGKYIEARAEAEIIDAVRTADAAGEQVLIIGGGSNLLISDDGFPGTVGLLLWPPSSCRRWPGRFPRFPYSVVW